MKWNEAVKFMKCGGKIKRKHWHKADYLFMKPSEDKVYCDGGFDYFYVIATSHLRGEWIKSNY